MNKYSHLIGGEPSDIPRGADEISKRALVVFTLIEHAMTEHDEAPQRREWLERYGLVGHLTKEEKRYLYSENPTPQQDIDATWLAECLCVLLWSVGYLDTLPSDADKFDAADTFDLMPAYSEVTVHEFVSNANLRSAEELYDIAKSIQWAHGKARSREQSEVKELLQERHLAINWVVGYCGLPWHLMTTDT
jgi:hypothetical protein